MTQTPADQGPRGSIQASHWPEPLPETVWCFSCEARRTVTGFSGSSTGYVAGLYLNCGHREDPPWDIRSE